MSQAPLHVREALLALREKLTANASGDVYEPNPGIARTAELKEISRVKYEAYCRARGFEPDPGVA